MTIEDVLHRIEESNIECLKVSRKMTNNSYNLELPQGLVLKVENASEFVLLQRNEKNYDALVWPDDLMCSEFDGICVGFTRECYAGSSTIFLSEFEWLLSNVKRMLI